MNYGLTATFLPDETPRERWIVGGRWSSEPPRDGAVCETLVPDGGFAIPGLTDVHSHISWPDGSPVPADTRAYMDRNRAGHARTGVTLIRDMGSAYNAVIGLTDMPGLPRTQSAGHLLVLNEGLPFEPTPAEKLVEVASGQLALGARWIKVFADWSPDYGGPRNTGFHGDDEITYPLEILTAMVTAAHARGARVAAHTFSRPGVQCAIAAGVDSVEHAWGAERDEVRAMAVRGTAWVPLLGIARPMRAAARRDGEMDRVAWVDAAMERMRDTLVYARALGVPVFTGSDWFGAVLVPDEIGELCDMGLSTTEALAAGSWSARAWLGVHSFRDGDAVDLLWTPRDPRHDPRALLAPGALWVNGAQVAPSMHGVRPRYVPWRERDTDADRAD